MSRRLTSELILQYNTAAYHHLFQHAGEAPREPGVPPGTVLLSLVKFGRLLALRLTYMPMLSTRYPPCTRRPRDLSQQPTATSTADDARPQVICKMFLQGTQDLCLRHSTLSLPRTSSVAVHARAAFASMIHRCQG